jgi:hypothetical protein
MLVQDPRPVEEKQQLVLQVSTQAWQALLSKHTASKQQQN